MTRQTILTALPALLVAGALLAPAGLHAQQAAGAPAAPAAKPADGAAAEEGVPGVDMSKLNAEQKTLAMKIFREEKCNCGCGFTLADCRVKDQKCPISPGLCKNVVDSILAGKSEADIRKSLAPAAAQAPPPAVEGTKQEIDYTGSPAKGAKDAKVVIAEYSEFQCPWCSKAQPWLKEILAAYPNDVKVVFKHYPLPMHNQADYAAQASMAAAAQGKFWEMHDKMFDNQRQINPENVKAWAKEIGLDMAKFDKEMEAGTYKDKVAKDLAEGNKIGVRGTPTFFINGKKYNGPRDLASVKPIIDEELKGGTKAESKGAAAKPAAAETKKTSK